jgi:Major intrinsic protein
MPTHPVAAEPAALWSPGALPRSSPSSSARSSSGVAGSPSAARWFGPALTSGEFADAWLYILGPIAGAVSVALLYRVVMELDARPLPAQSPIRGESAEPPVAAG